MGFDGIWLKYFVNGLKIISLVYACIIYILFVSLKMEGSVVDESSQDKINHLYYKMRNNTSNLLQKNLLNKQKIENKLMKYKIR